MIASNVGGMRWTIKEGKTGLLFPAKDPVALADKVQYVLEHPEARKKMRENGIDRVHRLFSWDAVAKQMSQFYEDMLIEFYYKKAMNGKKQSDLPQ